MRDKGRLAMHATQATLAARPTWERDVDGRGYLVFDGIDDALITPTLTWGNGLATVIASVRKTSDTSRAMVLEGSGRNVFAIEAPQATGQGSVAIGQQGGNELRRYARDTDRPAPISCVISGTCNLSSNLVTLRINGVDVANDTTATGGGNFLDTPLTLGRRFGGGLAFSGRIHQVFAVNRILSLAEVQQVERWMRNKSGAY
jgi:hypothetical protein